MTMADHDQPGGWDPDREAARISAMAAKTGRQCGACSLCCKVLEVDEINKPGGRWCTHCKPGKGCTIYGSRPDICKTFACHWLINPIFGPEWQPTRSKMVLHPIDNPDAPPGHDKITLNINVDPAYPDAWRRSPYYEQIKINSRHTVIYVHVGKRRWLIFPDQDVETPDGTAVVTGPDGSHTVLPMELARKVAAEFDRLLVQRSDGRQPADDCERH